MLKNYLKVALRNIRRQKLYSAVNILGLSVGVSATLIIYIYIKNQYSYEAFWKDHDQIYRVTTKVNVSGNVSHYATSSFMVAEALKGFSMTNLGTRVFRNSGRIQVEDRIFHEEKLYMADSTFTELFQYQFLSGDPSTALNLPNSVVLSESYARKLFGTSDVLGETVGLWSGNEFYEHVVTGVMGNLPMNTHLDFELIVPLPQGMTERFVERGWGNYFIYTYFKAPSDFDPGIIEKELVKARYQISDSEFETLIGGTNFTTHPVQRFSEIHLDNSLLLDLSNGINEKYLYIFGMIGLFVITIACINYVNLSTALSTRRIQEVGLRKVYGSSKITLITQFMLETIILSLLTLAPTMALLEMASIMSLSMGIQDLRFEMFGQGSLMPIAIGLTMTIGLLSGFYPAFYMTSLKSIQSLRKKNEMKMRKGALRRILVITQFSIATTLIISSLLLYNQVEYMKSKDLGFDKDNVLLIQNHIDVLGDGVDAFKNSLLQLPEVQSTSNSLYSLANGLSSGTIRINESEEPIRIQWQGGDHTYANTMGISILKGRAFNPGNADSVGILLNEAAIAALNLEGDPVGQQILFRGYRSGPVEIVGIIKDFHFQPKHMEIAPFGVRVTEIYNEIAVKINSQDMPSTLAKVESIWNEHTGGQPFDFRFFDEEYDQMYRAESTLGQVLNLFTGLAIFVACLGMFGLSGFVAESNKREIGIRKVLGASVMQILTLISKNFSMEILVGMLIAIPLAYVSVSRWLQNFAYAVDISPWPFVFSFCGIILLGVITVAYHSLQAANTDPVKVLRDN